jgi:histidinol-phosphatase (PHP family)
LKNTQDNVKGVKAVVTYNFHTHTKRCGHASGDEREYIERAIAGGIKHMGFSDHAPFIYPDGHQDGYRVQINEAKDYVSDICALREEFKDRIEIYVGYEMEYYPKYFDEMLKIAKDTGAEYLILGQHFINNGSVDGFHVVKPNTDEESFKKYVDAVISAIKSGKFTYVAHPDIYNFTGDDKIFNDETTRLCIASKEHNVPLEINFLGIRDNRAYPNDKFWRIAAEVKSPVTFGHDAHLVKDAFDPESFEKAMEMAKELGLNYTGMPEIVAI